MDTFYCGSQWGYIPPGYTINIPAESCSVPLQLIAVVRNTTVTFSWKAQHDYYGFFIEYRVQGDLNWITSPMISGQGITLTLLENKTYEWRVRTACAPDRFSTWVNGLPFTTTKLLLPCTAPVITSSYSKASGWTISWPNTGTSSYIVSLFTTLPTGTVKIFSKLVTSSTNPVTFLIGFLDLGKYLIEVEAKCLDGTTAKGSLDLTVNDESVTTVDKTCGPVRNLTATATETGILASWFLPIEINTESI